MIPISNTIFSIVTVVQLPAIVAQSGGSHRLNGPDGSVSDNWVTDPKPTTVVVLRSEYWDRGFRVHLGQNVCVSSESNRISEIAVCKPSTRQSRPRSVRSATQT